MKCLMPTCLLCLQAAALWGTEPPDTNYDESKVPHYTLPALQTGSRQHWEKTRRPEILQLLETAVYGRTPGDRLNVAAAVTEGPREVPELRAIRRQLTLSVDLTDRPQQNMQWNVLIYSPLQATGKVPAFLGLNFEGNQTVANDPEIHRSPAGGGAAGKQAARWQVPMLMDHGFALVTAHRDNIDPDNYQNDFSDGPHPLFYESGQTQPGETEWGSIGGWAWALSRMADSLQDDQLIDGRRLAVIGHSRLGKTALWAGAQDSRFRVVISNNSGCGGAALYRRCYGERLHHMLKPVGYWFSRNHASFAEREHEMPVDQHMLLAAIAPRAVYVASATEDRWADPKGEFLSLRHAAPAWEIYGLDSLPVVDQPEAARPVSSSHLGYHLRQGKHDVTAWDWEQYLRFADPHLTSSR